MTIDIATGEPTMHVDTRGLWSESLMSLGTVLALMAIAAYSTGLWVSLCISDRMIEMDKATLLTFQLPELVVATSAYLLSQLAALKDRLPWGVRDGISMFGFFTAMSLLLDFL